MQDRLVQKGAYMSKLLVSLAILVCFYFDNATTEQKHACPPWGQPPEQEHSHENRSIQRGSRSGSCQGNFGLCLSEKICLSMKNTYMEIDFVLRCYGICSVGGFWPSNLNPGGQTPHPWLRERTPNITVRRSSAGC